MVRRSEDDSQARFHGPLPTKRSRTSSTVGRLVHLMLLWFADLMNVTEEDTIHRPNVSTLLSNAFIRGDLDAVTRGPFI
ncbi:unnamed protein product [Pocillopora meandrina]|uniref:Uncharacterized protein n=1 Tax=Pocillopora meandrina TaxID=46732 RepID=A0AAU9Y502_9CNID|nr:unnamed protein product [Pocillopora meandrina]CAH3163180.1 unnamed protein product [Pocillopora meandrina]CAH3169443.1 unnamed protein product [Pocillopora meandrina]